VRGFFQLEELGALSPAGSSETIEAYELHGEGSARTRLDLQDRTERSGLVGRGSAMATLESALADARKGKGLVLAVEGAPGVGKSRLCLEFALRCREQGHAVCEVHCPPHGRTLPHFALYELARSLIGFDAGDSLGEVKRRIRSRLAPLGEDDPEVVRILSEALSEPDLPSDSGEAGRSVQTLGAADNAKRLAAILLRVFERIQARAAFVVLIDDLHWIDPDSEAFLARLAVLAETGRTLLLVNFRPEYEPLWTAGRRFRQLGLGPLDRASSYALIEERIGNDRSLADLPSHIHSKAGGNPLFIEELIRSLVESGKLVGRVGEYRSVETPEPLEIPDTIQALVAARIDRLQERDKQVLQVAAVIGKSFSQPVLARMVDCPEDALADSLQELHRVEFIQGETQLESLSFVHPLTQEVAYRSLLAERRKELHGRAARALVEVGERLGQSAALIAHHFEEAGRLWQARRWRQRARLLVTNIVPSGALREPDKK
jgi:predicted ATPase